MAKSRRVIKIPEGVLVRYHYCTRISLKQEISQLKFFEFLDSVNYKNTKEYEYEDANGGFVIELKSKDTIEFSVFNVDFEMDDIEDPGKKFEAGLYEEIVSVLTLFLKDEQVKTFDIHCAGVIDYGRLQLSFKNNSSDKEFKPSELTSRRKIVLSTGEFDLEESISIVESKGHNLVEISSNLVGGNNKDMKYYKQTLRALLIDENPLIVLRGKVDELVGKAS
jgi:hypothetical protein